ncbi:chromosome segregation protein SMC [Amnibacterium flavum]|uniref:Chromosome partition protein Smc n=1 Tax=Amnibacterium flavum TaxID=2173173 RepID=A0A2V1HXP5_9MICO|nr:chromosome segregation protein SMC [Amnibacterium flavum]PVZ96100.1 chromosome segregation protein SMC [Amnibacterium flavum]
MYLKSLTLKGFKSFAQPTTFAFEPGVTCVVGPNGSGKSNVVDALAWVMGEQGAKTLRGGKMEDVIFAGTATKGPLGRAEVTLTIDNSDGALPIEYSEVTIRRTLFRNGGSEYAINGENCRLLDVQELLSDSGLGREMHVIVGQGQLDTVLHASPVERRGFIEEAAGILKHRRRKEKTQRKLESMQTNLTRLSDLAGEIRRQLKPLGAQAEVAREAATIQAEVRDARARLLADEVTDLRQALEQYTRTEQERGEERSVLSQQLDERSARAAAIEATQTSDEVDLARRTAFGLESVQERLRSLYTLANQRLALLGNVEETPSAGPSVTSAMVEDARAELERLRSAVGGAEAALVEAQLALQSSRAELDRVDETIAAQSAEVSRYDLSLSQLRGRADTAASRLASVRGEVLRQQNALDSAAERRASAQARLEQAESESVEADEGEHGLDLVYEQAQAAIASTEGELERLRDALHRAERERDALSARTGALSLALDVKDGSGALAAARLAGVRGLVADTVTVEQGWESAVAAALGPLADAVVADDVDAALAALAHATEADLGRVEVVVADSDAAASSEIDGATPANAIVRGPRGIESLLASTVFVDDLDAGRAVWQRARRASPPVTVITRAGEVLTPYVLRGGTGRERSRIELTAERDRAASRLDEVQSEIAAARTALDEKRAEHALAREQSSSALAALREVDAKVAARSETLSRLRAQVDAADAEHERLARTLDGSAAQVADAEAAAGTARAEFDAVTATPRPLFDPSAREPLNAAVERAREVEVETRLSLETARERVRSEIARIAELERQVEAERLAAEEAARRAVIRRRQMDSATRVAEALPAVLDAVGASVAEARVELERAEADRARRNTELTEIRRGEAELRARLHTITESVHGLELQIYEKRLHVASLLERVGALGLDEETLLREYGPHVLIPVPRDPADAAEPEKEGAAEPDGIPFVRAEQQRRLDKAERGLAQLGRVNPLALEEFAALEQRHKFLTDQLADLTDTRRDLITIIDELDETMQRIFLEAFEDTKAAFGEVFPVLFPGGSGSIELTEPDDLLNTGIEVSVRPAGKKIERLSLLSGGERSLAAVALLIAIFKARPSPFYIMDEVEAALDDANLGRLLTVFEDLRRSSQLIVITHQKRTMELADALYGVSMRQDGISAVVGQRVQRTEPEPVAS